MIQIESGKNACPICGGTLEAVTEKREVRVGARRTLVMDLFSRCAVCGESLYSPGQLDATLRRASEAIRREEGLLSPETIRKIREGLGLTQSSFEKLLGVGPKTVVRWEKGTVFQNRSTDSLLRLVETLPQAALFLSRLHAVPLPRGSQGDRIAEDLPPMRRRASSGPNPS